MGAWGIDTFENDSAIDWTYGLEGCDDLGRVDEALAAVVETGPAHYLEADVACHALAAADTVARLLGRFGQRSAYSETVDAWVAAHPGLPVEGSRKVAIAAIDRILGPKSELAALWDEGDGSEWREVVAALRARLA